MINYIWFSRSRIDVLYRRRLLMHFSIISELSQSSVFPRGKNVFCDVCFSLKLIYIVFSIHRWSTFWVSWSRNEDHHRDHLLMNGAIINSHRVDASKVKMYFSGVFLYLKLICIFLSSGMINSLVFSMQNQCAPSRLPSGDFCHHQRTDRRCHKRQNVFVYVFFF